MYAYLVQSIDIIDEYSSSPSYIAPPTKAHSSD